MCGVVRHGFRIIAVGAPNVGPDLLARLRQCAANAKHFASYDEKAFGK